MRGVFTAGVLDYFLDHNIEFPYVVGVSAGCGNAFSFLSRQRGRSLYIHTTLLDDYRYIGLKSFVKTGEFIDMNLLYNKLPDEIYPFDIESFAANKTHLESVATNALTGEPCYMGRPNDIEELKLICRASGSLPFLNRVVEFNGVPMVDGGVADSIPLERALSRGYERALVISTQCRGFRKRVSRRSIPKWAYPKYPKVVEKLNGRAEYYNSQMERVEELERSGQVDVIRPQAPLVVGRLTTNTKLLKELYDEGYASGKEWVEQNLKC